MEETKPNRKTRRRQARAISKSKRGPNFTNPRKRQARAISKSKRGPNFTNPRKRKTAVLTQEQQESGTRYLDTATRYKLKQMGLEVIETEDDGDTPTESDL